MASLMSTAAVVERDNCLLRALPMAPVLCDTDHTALTVRRAAPRPIYLFKAPFSTSSSPRRLRRYSRGLR
ncbi:predicted protein [Plenodomus lingam JN3]|uniref:Predicted protein n=1 Tax=Leptosphaeria maculans (strain JN3 / isolate v23.1.3 / race Av1-4-5-6-7-8) TaxID=985895 RepID=E5AE94_LEPMJ|nr:predicted protein [Plenodomus lingam JN3]CBY01533.1 predicted protein [Plenodomus lingam JN3]